MQDGELMDPDPTDFDRWCQYIFYKNTECLSFYHVDTGYMSDTEALAADMRVSPKKSKKGDEESEKKDSLVAEFKRYHIKDREFSHRYTGARKRGFTELSPV